MALVTCEGIVLKTHPLGDTSRIVVAYARETGLLRMVAKGARKTPSRFGFALEPLSRSRFVVYVKPDRDLQLLSQAETLDALGSRLGSLVRLAHAEAAIELMDRLVWGEEPHAALFDLLVSALARVADAPEPALPAVTAGFELHVASLLGYRPSLEACAQCGGAPGRRRAFSPARGGILCDRCATGEAGALVLSQEALEGLTLLLERPIAEAAEVKRSGEILKVVEALLRHHFQRFQGLRSLELLRALDQDHPRAARPARTV